METSHLDVGGAPGGAGQGREGRPGRSEHPRMRLQLTIFKYKINNCSNIHLGKQLGKRPWSGTAGNGLGGEGRGHSLERRALEPSRGEFVGSTGNPRHQKWREAAPARTGHKASLKLLVCLGEFLQGNSDFQLLNSLKDKITTGPRHV